MVGGILRDENLNSGTHDKAVVPTDLELTDALDEIRASARTLRALPLWSGSERAARLCIRVIAPLPIASVLPYGPNRSLLLMLSTRRSAMCESGQTERARLALQRGRGDHPHEIHRSALRLPRPATDSDEPAERRAQHAARTPVSAPRL